MSDQSGAIPLGLSQQKAARNIDPEQLEAMGKRAASRFSEMPGESLSESVVEIVKEARLAPEQVKRVCEFANTAAYLHEFEKGGSVRNVTFDGGPANPSIVLKDLNDGSSPAVHQVKTASYQPPTSNYKLAGAGDSILAEAFGGGITKTADQHGHARAGEEAVDLRTRLQGVKDDLNSKYASSGVLLNDVRHDLCDAVRQEVLGGTTLGSVVGAWSGYAPSANMLKEAMEMVGKHLRTTGDMDSKSLTKSLVKTAAEGSIPNPEHPIVDRFIAFTKIASEHRKLESAIQIVDEQLVEVNEVLRGMA